MYFGTNSIEAAYFGEYEVQKAYFGTDLVYEKGGSYEQQWSDEQPSQHNTPVPIDAVGLTTGVIDAVQTKVYEATDYELNNPDAIGLTTGVIDATVEDLSL